MDRQPAKAGSSPAPFQAILSNRSDGSSALFGQFVQLARGQSRDVVSAGLQACLKTFPLMAVWPYALAQLSEGRQDLEQASYRMTRQTEAAVARAAAALEAYQAVLTLSNSSLVRRAILVSNASKQVLCTVSQPGGEGQLLAEYLRQEGVKALVVKDEKAPQVIKDVDAVLLGADQYDDEGFINKVGSRNLARHARRLGKPVLVLAEEFKRVSRLPKLTPELAALELETGGKVSRQTVFERVPWQPHIRLISGFD